ncbi:hypothetical protein M407DRAFT_126620 [Tulasnella calospora MUT 4182]|uniref:Cyclin-domain-containing protein n=1 Tax=Tulasnella calospora MUT 4182 TaxID=1051891 RepID=A0A0C3LJ08_9AGAM|nr:hypothetical protein M407DRAFT_126620 [Tulasnella calospora MUT 4182]
MDPSPPSSSSSSNGPSASTSADSRTSLAPRFEDCEVQHLVELIADMIDRLIAHNDQIPLQPDALTRFHSRLPPGISVHDYFARIVKYANVDRSCLLITLHYIDQICTRLPKFTITSLTIHRFIIASITVSSKALCDVFCTNTHYAKVGGITVAELNMLEKEFLSVIDWRLFCTRELLQAYYVNLIRTHSKHMYKLDVEQPPEHTPIAPTSSPDAEEEDEAAGLSMSQEDAYEADSTAHAASCSASCVTTEDEGMRETTSDSDSSGDEDEDPPDQPVAVPSNLYPPSSQTVTPRTAAKRRALSLELAHEEDVLRPRGRRRLDGP